MTEKRFTKCGNKIRDNGEEMNTKEVCDLLNLQDERIKTLLEDNDHKFWKLQFMKEYNSFQILLHEIYLAIEQGYGVSDDFKQYLEDLKKRTNEAVEKVEKELEQREW